MPRQMSVREVAERHSNDPDCMVLLDVREHDERAFNRIEPSLHIPMNDVPRRLSEIPKDREVVVYCHHGSRSAMVAAYLTRAGFEKVTNLEGGIDAWSRHVDPKIPRYG
ncbi:MAG: rhodanese-like domain-containing protein [Thermoplasmata archaeon]